MSISQEKSSTGASASAASHEDNRKEPGVITYLNAFNSVVAFSLVANGLVGRSDLLFTVFASLYVFIMSTVVKSPVASTAPSRMLPVSRIFAYYVTSSVVFGLILPQGLILVSFWVRGHQDSVRDAAPHLFLLLAQVTTENLTMFRASISRPVRALVPIMYNARRLTALWTWTVVVWSRDMNGLSSGFMIWLVLERALVVANLFLWNFNLWAFLLPVYLPLAFRTHYVEEGSKQASVE